MYISECRAFRAVITAIQTEPTVNPTRAHTEAPTTIEVQQGVGNAELGAMEGSTHTVVSLNLETSIHKRE